MLFYFGPRFLDRTVAKGAMNSKKIKVKVFENQLANHYVKLKERYMLVVFYTYFIFDNIFDMNMGNLVWNISIRHRGHFLSANFE